MRIALAFALPLVTLLATGCTADGQNENAFTEGSDDGGLVDPDAPSVDPSACEGPLGKPVEPASLPACCEAYPNKAACYGMDKVPDELKSVVGKCGDGSACIPNDFLRTGGVFTPKECKSLGGPGVCLSRCIPMVEEKAAILPWDVCDEESERCVPCISPLDHKPTGACEIKGACKGEDAGPSADTGPVDTGPPMCPHEGPPVIDPASLPSCQCGGAHCLPPSVVPTDLSSKLADCTTGAGKCVPDDLIASGGEFIPKTCHSIAGNEGRCLSSCLPDVAAQATMLPRDVCADTEKCVPCTNPLDGKDTGACKLSCDPGPTEPAKPLPKCCKDRGSCVPASAAGSAAKNLTQDSCADKADVCAPDVFLHKTWKRIDCEASTILLGSAGPGVCMPECIDGMSFLLQKGACPDGMKCAPCKDPLTKKSTGACEFSL
ncbi:MAG: hypothetical protein ACXVEF_14390 [Polyangiales bacterium]